jgi:protein lysine acetyltransferase
MSPQSLTAHGVLAGCDEQTLATLTSSLRPLTHRAGDVVMNEGDDSTFFALIVTGTAVVSTREGRQRTLGPGDIVGEIGLLTGEARTATVTAATALYLLCGDTADLGRLLDVAGVDERLRTVASQRLADDIVPISATDRHGATMLLRPLLPADRATLTAAVRQASAETIRMRFFSAASVSQRVIDYLVDINYRDHFAWVACDDSLRPVALARTIRDRHIPTSAEVAFVTGEAARGRGLATLLLGALGATGEAMDTPDLLAVVLAENEAMRTVIRRASATTTRDEPGVVRMSFAAADAAALLDPAIRDGIRSVVERVATGPWDR